MGPDLSHSSFHRLPRVLLVENNFSIVEPLIRTFGDRRLDFDFDACTSVGNAANKKYRDHLAAYPWGNEMDATFNKTLAAIEQSIVSYQQSILRIEGFADLAAKLESKTRTRALERLDSSPK